MGIASAENASVTKVSMEHFVVLQMKQDLLDNYQQCSSSLPSLSVCVDQKFWNKNYRRLIKVVTATPTEKEAMPEEPEEEPVESAEPTTVEEGDVQDMVCIVMEQPLFCYCYLHVNSLKVDENSDPNSEDSAATDATDSGDYGGDAEIPEEALSSSAIIVSLTSVVLAAMFF